ncbi:MAG TPA: hypothetical protein VGK74_10495 [Symbiobacteriaceae bacterium]|jgi:hypothetical protein
MKGFLIRAGAAVVGLAVGVFYLGWLMDLGVIALGLNWGPSDGGGLILLVLFAAPTVAVLLVDGRKYLETVILFLIVLVLPVAVHFAGQISQKATLAKEQQVGEQWKAEAVAAVRQVAGAVEVLANHPTGHTACDKILLWAGTPEGGTWYWYDASARRIDGSVTEARLAQLVRGYLRAGDGVGSFAPYEGHPQLVTFTYTYPESPGRGRGEVELAGKCTFTIDSVNFGNPPPGIKWLNAPALAL